MADVDNKGEVLGAQENEAQKLAKMLDNQEFVKFLAKLDPNKDFNQAETEKSYTAFNEASEAFSETAKYIREDFTKKTGIELKPEELAALKGTIEKLAVDDPARIHDLVESVKKALRLPKEIKNAESEFARISGAGPEKFSDVDIKQKEEEIADLTEFLKNKDFVKDFKDWLNILDFPESHKRKQLREKIEGSNPGVLELGARKLMERVEAMKTEVKAMKEKAKSVDQLPRDKDAFEADLASARATLKTLFGTNTQIQAIIKNAINRNFAQLPTDLSKLGAEKAKVTNIEGLKKESSPAIDGTLDINALNASVEQKISDAIGERVVNILAGLNAGKSKAFTPFIDKIDALVKLGKTAGIDEKKTRDQIVDKLELQKANLISSLQTGDNAQKLVLVKAAIANLKARTL